MFVWGCGRCDLAGGDPEQMYNTLRKLASLPDSTLTLPGHNYSDQCTATMEEQRQGNPFLHFHDQGKFVDYRMHQHDKIRHSPYHAEHKK